MEYKQALEYIHSINWQFCKPGLERVEKLCAALGNVQDTLRIIHVAGTNGKGSFCAMLDGILRSQGFRVGLFTSPYILDFCERIRVNGQNIPKEELCALVESVMPIAEKMQDKPTEFELICALAFLYFAKQNCDFVILECGLGGRLDATNIIKSPLLSVITGISLDHTAILGETVEEIAAQKAGIIKENTPVLWCGNDLSAEKVIRDTAKKLSAPFFTAEHEKLCVKNMNLDGTRFDFGKYTDLTLSLLGTYQPTNAANVLSCVDILKELGVEISDGAVREGLFNTVWHARFELLCKDPVIIADGGHNPEGIDGAVKSVLQYFPKGNAVVITGVMADKDYEYMAKKISQIASKVFCITPQNPRALDAECLAKVFRKLCTNATSCSCVGEAVGHALLCAKSTSCPIICLGSLYMYAELAKHIKVQLEEKGESSEGI